MIIANGFYIMDAGGQRLIFYDPRTIKTQDLPTLPDVVWIPRLPIPSVDDYSRGVADERARCAAIAGGMGTDGHALVVDRIDSASPTIVDAVFRVRRDIVSKIRSGK